MSGSNKVRDLYSVAEFCLLHQKKTTGVVEHLGRFSGEKAFQERCFRPRASDVINHTESTAQIQDSLSDWNLAYSPSLWTGVAGEEEEVWL